MEQREAEYRPASDEQRDTADQIDREVLASAPPGPPALLIPRNQAGREGEDCAQPLRWATVGPVFAEDSSVEDLGDDVRVVIDAGVDSAQRHGELVRDHPRFT